MITILALVVISAIFLLGALIGGSLVQTITGNRRRRRARELRMSANRAPGEDFEQPGMMLLSR